MGGHYDSHDICPGARDNASGLCVVLDAARALCAAGFRPRHTLRFVAFGSEEIGLRGSNAHVEMAGEAIGDVKLMVNVDCPPESGTRGFQFVDVERVRPFLDDLSRRFGSPVAAVGGLHPHSDHFPFFLAGVPVANLVAAPKVRRSARGWGHTRADTPDKLVFDGLRVTASFLARSLVRLAGPGGPELPRRSPAEVAAILTRTGLDEVLSYEG